MPAISAPPSSAPSAADAALDDADALPAVGKVWDEGPKRSLSEIMAAAGRPKPQTADQRPQTGLAITPELQAIWQTFLQRVQEQFGPPVHVPLASGEPRREGSTLIVRFAGPFAVMASFLEKHRDQLQRMVSEIAGEQLGLQLVADHSAPPPKIAPLPNRANPAGAGNAGGNAPASIVTNAPREGLPLTPDVRAELEKNPLIRSILEGFNGTIVKLENKETE